MTKLGLLKGNFGPSQYHFQGTPRFGPKAFGCVNHPCCLCLLNTWDQSFRVSTCFNYEVPNRFLFFASKKKRSSKPGFFVSQQKLRENQKAILLNNEAYFRFSLREGAQRSAVKVRGVPGDRPRGDMATCLGKSRSKTWRPGISLGWLWFKTWKCPKWEKKW